MVAGLLRSKVKDAIERTLGEIKNRLLENVEPYACQYAGLHKYRNRMEAEKRAALVAPCRLRNCVGSDVVRPFSHCRLS